MHGLAMLAHITQATVARRYALSDRFAAGAAEIHDRIILMVRAIFAPASLGLQAGLPQGVGQGGAIGA
ncbi:hypothetical protein GCM10009504_25870 [Pseudomonas laurentiana]|nr:hypothetical protein GCM10009504_25870 [Pseudomonas laurentiana]